MGPEQLNRSKLELFVLDNQSKRKLYPCYRSVLILVVFPNPGVVGYTLLGYNDVGDGDRVDGLAYRNTPLSSCEVAVISLSQFEGAAVQQSVQISGSGLN
jgi:hypothetical protein